MDMPWLPRSLKGKEALEAFRLHDEEGLTWPEIVKITGLSRQTLWRRRKWLEENYLLRAGIPVHWLGRPNRLAPNSGATGTTGKVHEWTQRTVKLPVPPHVEKDRPLPVFKVDPIAAVKIEVDTAKMLRSVLHAGSAPETTQ